MSGPNTRSIGRLSGATTWTSRPRVRNDAAASRPMKLAPMISARRASLAAAMMARESASERSGRRLAARLGLGELLAHEDAAVALLDPPAGERAQRRRAHGLAAAQIEAGMMPGAAHAVPDHQPVGERPMIMRAMGPDREHL